MSEDISILRYEELPPQKGYRQQRVSFTWGKRSKPVPGILKLVQAVIKIMLTSPGTDHFNVQMGTILPILVKRGVTQSSVQLIKMDVMATLQDLERQIIDIQSGELLPADERLKEILVRRIEFLQTSNEWQIEISVISDAGQTANVDISPYLKGK